MDEKADNKTGEIEETGPKSDGYSPNPNPNPKTARTKVPEVEVCLYRQGKGPIDTFKSGLGGWDQNQLEVGDILDKYGFKSLYAFNTESGRGVPIRFNPRNGRSMLPYRDGATVHIDGEPKDSMIQPVTKILIGVAFMTILITLVLRDPPQWIQKLNITGGNFPPWIIALVIIVFTRMRKRTRDLLKKFGW
ncbi:hypothetical protein ACFX2J_002648 [Malus domestica]|uniref:uncharacterized protein n=1 Tax=Malus domestica TaxID=3750 RepID=UPI000498A8FA|nr:uncharacterized protein LOC103400358 [Malus domestica]